jgi:hypothetical protein
LVGPADLRRTGAFRQESGRDPNTPAVDEEQVRSVTVLLLDELSCLTWRERPQIRRIGDLAGLQRLLGHAGIRTTMCCVHVAGEEPHEGVR